MQGHVLGEDSRAGADLQYPRAGTQVLVQKSTVYLERDPPSDVLAQPLPLSAERVEDPAHPVNRVIRS